MVNTGAKTTTMDQTLRAEVSVDIIPPKTTTSASTRKVLPSSHALGLLPLPLPLLPRRRTVAITLQTRLVKPHSNNRPRHRQASLSRTSTNSPTEANILTPTRIILALTMLIISISNLVVRTARAGMAAARTEKGRCTDNPINMACPPKGLMIMPRPLPLLVLASLPWEVGIALWAPAWTTTAGLAPHSPELKVVSGAGLEAFPILLDVVQPTLSQVSPSGTPMRRVLTPYPMPTI